MKLLVKIIVIIFVLIVGISIGYLLWGPRFIIPGEFKYDVLRDTLTIVLTVAGIFIAIIGFVVYKLVTEMIKSEAEKKISDETRRGITRLAASTGYGFWKAGHIEEAIRLTEEVYDHYTQRLSEIEPENELLIAEIRNNLACYYALKKDMDKKDLAKGYAEYIHSISHKYPQHREAWERTYREVAQVFPE